ncbi:hypothetical protein [Pseudoalteromonas agarivorans]|uniref:Uncharacterized protein n=1 Tax=Pseudoalteromonas agarivorans DSM 14585 TaxID=1312369 RepID=A0ACA8DTF8_9GAMM|nr:hypothetical protein [Pseudoalteromonas agarivorans]ATC81447.1 hypothetical protein PAGA_a0966 [Pseudoalteromonas agarivorans DSM 14585]
MTEKSYDQKNSEDYEANTAELNTALNKIESNKKLKATITALSKMTGIHRNTITNRGWPAERLKKIKEARNKFEQEQQQLKSQNDNDVQNQLESKFESAKKEIVYWFNEFQDMKRFYEHSDKRFQKMRESRDYYKELYERERKLLLATQQEAEQLRDLLELR